MPPCYEALDYCTKEWIDLILSVLAVGALWFIGVGLFRNHSK